MFFFMTLKKSRLIFGLLALAVILGAVFVYAAQPSEIPKDGVKVPILMYHSILKNKGSGGTYVISPELLESDLKYLKENGYTTVFVKELSDYVREGKDLPEKPVVVSLDDGYYNNLTYVLPLLQKYDMKASIAVVGKFTDIFSKEDSHNANYSHMTWDDISDMAKSGHIEISNHTYDMHSTKGRFGCFKNKSESEDDYKKALTEDVGKLQTELMEKSGIKCEVFTYPYGKIYNGSVPVIKDMGFLASLSCYEKMNYITREEDCLYLLGRFNRPSGISTQNFMKKHDI